MEELKIKKPRCNEKNNDQIQVINELQKLMSILIELCIYTINQINCHHPPIASMLKTLAAKNPVLVKSPLSMVDLSGVVYLGQH